jgi:hypothetical protein
VSEPRFCVICGGPLPAGRHHVCADCDRPPAEPGAGGDTGAPVIAWAAVGAVVLAAAGWLWWVLTTVRAGAD